MKRIFMLLFACYAFQLSAQDQTLFSDLSVIGAFGGPILEISSINGEVGSDVGGGGALILENIFFGGYGMGTDKWDYRLENGPFADDYNIKFRHGGLWLGYVPFQSKLAHLYTSGKIGWGKSQLREDGETRFSDRIFVLTPEIGVEVNVTSFFRLGITGGYRWVNGIDDLPGLDNADFSSPVGILTFRFGGFGEDWDWDF